MDQGRDAGAHHLGRLGLERVQRLAERLERGALRLGHGGEVRVDLGGARDRGLLRIGH